MELGALVAVVWALGAGWLLPGLAVAHAFELGRPGLERIVLGMAIGRVLLAAATLIATTSLSPLALHGWAALGVIAWLWSRRGRARARPTRETLALASICFFAALVLVLAVVARNGLADAAGALAFFGRDASNDPLVYAAIARQLVESGLPLSHPFIAATSTATYVQYGTLAGVHALGVPLLDAVFRVVPLMEATGLALAAAALVRALGGSTAAAAVGGALVVLGGEPSAWLRLLEIVPGVSVLALDSWALFGPFLLAFNPGAPALQLLFAAALLLARAPVHRRDAILAGLLVAACFETKLFVWAPAWAGLVFASLWPGPATRALRTAAVAASLASLPSLLEKSLWAASLRERDVTGFTACPGCLPRYLADAALGSHELSFALFRSFEPRNLLDPALLVATLASSCLLMAVALGARAAAIPVLLRGGTGRAQASPESVAVLRWLGGSALFGLGAALVFVTRPHYLNGAQFAWVATVGLWPLAALGFERAWHGRRWLLLALAAALVVPGTTTAVIELGVRAPLWRIVSADELALADAVRAHSEPGDVVLEPSMLESTEFPSPVAWRAGRSVWLSLLSTVQLLPDDELDRRYAELEAVFRGRDAAAAARAIERSGARLVVVPRTFPLRWRFEDSLEHVASSRAGDLYRVRRQGR